MTWCDLCDLDRATCVHGMADRTTARARTAVVLVSPRGVAHFDGCPHKGDDPDYARWGRIEGVDTWQVLGNGGHLPTVDTLGRPIIATKRCLDCVDHGPW